MLCVRRTIISINPMAFPSKLLKLSNSLHSKGKHKIANIKPNVPKLHKHISYHEGVVPAGNFKMFKLSK